MDIKRVGSQPSAKGPSEWFTGTVRIDPLFQAPDPALVQGASVTFEPGARTAWHTHPLGQTLIVTAGCGWAQREGGPIEEIRPGDVVWFPPGEKHWHGATPATAMTHIAIQEKLDGKVVDWMEQSVTSTTAGNLMRFRIFVAAAASLALEIHATDRYGRPLEASRSIATRPQHRYFNCFDRA
jgi:quercetin dioxygenase-like cupin family protein